MATKRYVSLDKLSLYDTKIKALMTQKDTETLDAAKSYADGLSSNYEQAGSIATAKSELTTKIETVQTAADNAQGAADAAQNDVDALETLVGTLPEGASTVVAYINQKTDGIATDTALSELAGRVTTAEGEIDAIQADYLKTVDKTEITDAIESVSGRVTTNADAIKAIQDDYLKAADKTALQSNIDTVSAGLADVKEDVDTFLASAEIGDAAIDTLKEIQDYINSDGAAAEAMTANIAKNADDIAALDTYVGDIPTEGVAATNVVDYAEEIVAAEKTRATGVEDGLDTRIGKLESAIGESGSVATDIATAKSEAIDAASADATAKADAALASAKTYTDGLNTSMDTRVKAVEDTSHTHENMEVLSGITATKVSAWDDASTKAHVHDNKAVLDGITDAQVTAWNAAETNAKTYADGLNTSMDARVTAVEDWQKDFVEVSESEILSLFQ